MTIEPTPWRNIEQAILHWFSESTGLKTIWANQDGPQPAWPYGILNRIAVTKVGQDGVRYEVENDRLDAHFCGLRYFTLSCQIDLGPIGKCDLDAVAALEAAQFALALPRYRERFRGVDIALTGDNDPIEKFDVVVADVWNSRAQMDLVFLTTANVTERDIHDIRTVKITSNITGTDRQIDDEPFGG